MANCSNNNEYFMRQKALINFKKALLYIKPLINNTPYGWWKNYNLADATTYAADVNSPLPKINSIKEQGINCVGLINLVRRNLGLGLPGIDIKVKGVSLKTGGGTYAWFKYFKTNNLLQEFSFGLTYPVGTLLLRNFKNMKNDPGHVGILYAKDRKNRGILFDKFLNSYPFDPRPEKNGLKPPGLIIDSHVGTTYFWFKNGTYSHICLPEHWLL
jgi:hypothetical protein